MATYSTKELLKTAIFNVLDPNVLAANKLHPTQHFGVLVDIIDSLLIESEVPALDGQLKVAKKIISSSDILAGNTVQILPAPGVGYTYVIHKAIGILLWESGNVAYSSINYITIYPLGIFDNVAWLIDSSKRIGNLEVIPSSSEVSSIDNSPMEFVASGANSGTSDLYTKVWYTIEPTDPTA